MLQFDEHLFHLINQHWQNAFFDWLLPHWRNKYFWIPLYVCITIFTIWKLRAKSIIFLVAVILTITLSDTISSKVVKPTIQRLRPCNVERLEAVVIERIPCGGGYSFTSSHATNHFALAVFLSLTLGARYRRIRWPLLLWAASIAYAQVYVGVHYPLDVVAGAILGTVIGLVMAKIYKKIQAVHQHQC